MKKLFILIPLDFYNKKSMHMKLLCSLIPILFIMFACAKPQPPDSENMRIEYRRYCSTSEEQSCFGSHYVGCAEAANPKSDEEPEDWLPHCKRAARQACCPLVKGTAYKYDYGERYWIPWSEVPEDHKTVLNNRG